jgi:hypothetical protein
VEAEFVIGWAIVLILRCGQAESEAIYSLSYGIWTGRAVPGML